jgi:hypothetical protein
MIDRARISIDKKKLSKLRGVDHSVTLNQTAANIFSHVQEKGIIIAEISSSYPMKIVFLNKTAQILS